MTNNDTLRRLRYVFDFTNAKIVALFALADQSVTKDEVIAWLKKEDEEGYKNCSDVMLATFLNGFINDRRGKREGEQPKPEKKLTNNMILVKLKIALNLKAEDLQDIMQLAEFTVSQHELSAFFRKPGNKHYRQCKDQILRNFLMGVQIKYRGKPEQSKQKTVERTPEAQTPSVSEATDKPKAKFDWKQ